MPSTNSKKESSETTIFKPLKFNAHDGYLHNGVSCLAVSENGEILISGGWDKKIRVYSLLTGNCIKTLERTWLGYGKDGHTEVICSVGICADGDTIVSSCHDNTIRIWSLKTGECKHILEKQNPYFRIIQEPEGAKLMVENNHNQYSVYSIQSGQLLQVIKFSEFRYYRRVSAVSGSVYCKEHEEAINNGKFDPDSGLMQDSKLGYINGVAAEKHILCLDNKKLMIVYREHEQHVQYGTIVHSYLRIWSLETKQYTFRKPTQLYTPGFNPNLLSVNGDRIIWWGEKLDVDRHVYVKDKHVYVSTLNEPPEDNHLKVDRGEGISHTQTLVSPGPIFSVTVSIDDEVVAASSAKDESALPITLCVWAAKTGESLRQINYESYIEAIKIVKKFNHYYAIVGLRNGKIHFQHIYTAPKITAQVDATGLSKLSGCAPTQSLNNMTAASASVMAIPSSAASNPTTAINSIAIVDTKHQYEATAARAVNEKQLTGSRLVLQAKIPEFSAHSMPPHIYNSTSVVTNSSDYPTALAASGLSVSTAVVAMPTMNSTMPMIPTAPPMLAMGIDNELLTFLNALKSTGVNPNTLLIIQNQIAQLQNNQILLTQELGVYTAWIKEYSTRVVQLEAQMDITNQLLQRDTEAQKQQSYINGQTKLKNYQRRIQQELCRFITCYYLAPAGLFQLTENKKEKIIKFASQTIEAIPGIGKTARYVLSGLFIALSYANEKYRFLQINRVSDLFDSPNQIISLCCQFSRMIVLAKEAEIQKLEQPYYEGWRKIVGLLENVKAIIEHQIKDLATSDNTGISLPPEENLAITDAAYLLQQIMSGDAKIDKEKAEGLSSQFVVVLTGKPYQPAIVSANVITIPISVVNPADHMQSPIPVASASSMSSPAKLIVSPSLTSSTVTPPIVPPNSPSVEEMARKLQLLEEQMTLEREQARQREEAIQRALDKHREEQAKLKESLKDMGASVDGGNMAQVLATPRANSGEGGSAQITYLLERDREHSERLRQLELGVSIIGETAVTRETVSTMVATAVKSVNSIK